MAEASRDQRPTLHPTVSLLTVAGLFLAVSLVIQFVHFDNLWYALSAYLVAAVGIALPFIYRRYRRRQQFLLNHWAAAHPDLEGFILYLRPFMTSGRLMVRCSVKSVSERFLYGPRWDLEFALSAAVGDRQLVAIGDVKNAFGAAKLTTSDNDWKNVLDDLARRARLIVIVPLPRPSTLWELEHILDKPDYVRKTLVIMPPSFWGATVRGWLLARRSVASLWRQSRADLKAKSIELPAYHRRGMMFVPHDGGFAPVDTWRFQPDYLEQLFAAAGNAAAGGRPMLPELETIAKYPGVRRRRFLLVNRSLAVTIWAVLIVAILFRGLVAEPFSVPTGSNQPTLMIGDYFIASKSLWGIGAHSFIVPLPLDARWGQLVAPARGDMAVFYNAPTRETYVKRIIALPGDTVQMYHGRLVLNGAIVPRTVIGPATDTDSYGEAVPVTQYRETLPGGRSYVIQEIGDNEMLDNAGPWQIGEGCYFVMGDNRDRSADSRVLQQVGCVPDVNLVGPAALRFLSLDPGFSPWRFWEWPAHIRWDRMMQPIQ